jgi:hypothetical protein
MKNILDFKKYIINVKYTPHRLAEMNNLIFHNWNEMEAKKYFPENIIKLISDIQNDDKALDEIYDCLVPES